VQVAINTANLRDCDSVGLGPARLDPIAYAFESEPKHVKTNRDITY
jgi:hypothetical protein